MRTLYPTAARVCVTSHGLGVNSVALGLHTADGTRGLLYGQALLNALALRYARDDLLIAVLARLYRPA